MGHDRGMLDQAFDPTQAFRQSEQLTALQEPLGAREVALQHHGHDAAEAVHLTLGKCMLRMTFETGINHALHIAARFQPARDPETARTMALHA